MGEHFHWDFQLIASLFGNLRSMYARGASTDNEVLTQSLVLQWLGQLGLGNYVALANNTTALGFATKSVVALTVTADKTLTSTIPPAGSRCTLIVLTSGTDTWTITFGTGFKTTGTLATGTSDAKYFVLHFVSDGVTLYEVSRTTAM